MGKVRKKKRLSSAHVQPCKPPTLLDMPDVVLVEVLRCLCIGDRYNVSCTCKRLRDMFQHPQVWRHVSVDIVGFVVKPALFGHLPMMKSTVFAFYVNLFERFGHFVHSLSFRLMTECDSPAPSWEQLVRLVMKKCCPQLESLVISPHALVSGCLSAEKHRERYDVQRKYLLSFISLVEASPHLHSLSILFWPKPDPHRESQEAPRTDGLCIFEAVLKSQLNLTHLEIYSQIETRSQNTLLQHVGSEIVVQFLQKFKNLQVLAIGHGLIDQTVLQELASSGRTKGLHQLHIAFGVVFDCRHTDFGKVDVDVWEEIKARNPQMRVKMSVSRFSAHRLTRILASSIPLVDLSMSASCFKSGEDERTLLSCLMDNHHDTLEKLKLSGLRETSMPLLVALTKKCQRLTSLQVLIVERVHYSVILEIARVHRSSWRQLRLPSYGICYEQHPQAELPSNQRDCPLPCGCAFLEQSVENQNLHGREMLKTSEEPLPQRSISATSADPSCSMSLAELDALKDRSSVDSVPEVTQEAETHVGSVTDSTPALRVETTAGTPELEHEEVSEEGEDASNGDAVGGQRRTGERRQAAAGAGGEAASLAGFSPQPGRSGAKCGDVHLTSCTGEQTSEERGSTSEVWEEQQGAGLCPTAPISSEQDLEVAVSSILGYTWMLAH